MKVISSLPCFIFRNSDDLKEKLNSISPEQIQMHKATCEDKIRGKDISPLEDQYFMIMEDPTLSLYCQLRLKLEEKRPILTMYGIQLAKSICLVGFLVFFILVVIDVGDIFPCLCLDSRYE